MGGLFSSESNNKTTNINNRTTPREYNFYDEYRDRYARYGTDYPSSRSTPSTSSYQQDFYSYQQPRNYSSPQSRNYSSPQNHFNNSQFQDDFLENRPTTIRNRISNNDNYNSLIQDFRHCNISQPKPLPSLGPLTKHANSLLKTTNELPTGKSYNLITLDESEIEYIEVRQRFMSTTQKHYEIRKIERIENPFLYGCYLLKKQELNIRNGFVSEAFVFHGTKAINIPSICENNLDWRFYGKSRGNKFGKGVSFSQISKYSSHSRDSNNGINKMLCIKMLFSYMIAGDSEDILPKIGFNGYNFIQPDTTFKDKYTKKGLKEVLVKFSDHEFYPAYVITYSGRIIYPQKH